MKQTTRKLMSHDRRLRCSTPTGNHSRELNQGGLVFRAWNNDLKEQW